MHLDDIRLCKDVIYSLFNSARPLHTLSPFLGAIVFPKLRLSMWLLGFHNCDAPANKLCDLGHM